MLAPIRLTNAAAQLVLRTQVRRKETHPHHPSAPLPPLRGFIERFANPYYSHLDGTFAGYGRHAMEAPDRTKFVRGFV